MLNPFVKRPVSVCVNAGRLLHECVCETMGKFSFADSL